MSADPARVIAQLFVPGHHIPGGSNGRATGVVAHVLDLDEDQVSRQLADLLERFGQRHRNLLDTFRRNAERIGNRLHAGVELSEERWLLLGATFTHEYSIEAAALCNPSAVALPDQSGVAEGSLAFVMAVRQIGEGHRSSIGFRTGVLDGGGEVTIDRTGHFTVAGTIEASRLQAATFRTMSQRNRDDAEATAWVLEGLGPQFEVEDLALRLFELESQRDTRRNVAETIRRFRELASRTYTATFAETTELSERVLYPAMSLEANGMEDARFVRFLDDDGSVTFYATYTAFDGRVIALQLLATKDFRTFEISPLQGPAAANKGMALFPRRIGGKFAALSRPDGATNAVAFSDDIGRWPDAIPFDCAPAAWEVVQVGNCGPPIETPAGWLVLTHGVGPMRTYSIGAWLLDLDDPTVLVGRLHEPLLVPQPEEQDGYVPNVVYSCGGVLHGGALLIPFGIGDSAIGFATVALDELLGAMRREVALGRT